MSDPVFQPLAQGITCIDANYVAPGVACFYLLESEGEVAVIETGTQHSLPNLEICLQASGIAAQQVRYIIPTHVHLDHAGGAGAMMARYPQAELLIHPRGARHMADPTQLVAGAMAVYGEAVFAQLYGDVLPVDPARIVALEDGASRELGGRRLEFRHTQGHARHHLCLWDEVSRSWFSGDMFGVCYPWFRNGDDDYLLPSTTPTQFDPDAYLASLHLLDSYNPRAMLLTHSGRIAYSEDKMNALAEQVQDYRQLAQAHAAQPENLEAALMQYAVRRLIEVLGCPEPQAREWLHLDIALNAQGLAHWLTQHADVSAPDVPK